MSEDVYRSLALRDGRYSPEAFRFLNEALQVAVRLAGKEEQEDQDRHVTGQQILEGMRELARERFGPLAAQVWRSWGIRSTRDWGEIVFLLVDAKQLRRQESDTKEDFAEDFDFDEVFVREYRPVLPDDLGTGEPS